ncbi:hypothetical protein Y032_0153g2940 [Ancylostoma ceylanicum]|uniref:Uncharacterized protein n=1 Tax=Ancylostoma ceylanicum TaxID=53326 RepID=A0A016T0R5_9BILA|nr:hypothetical protein Y032_0153g2940 [Ancylostoma ceylanicum]
MVGRLYSTYINLQLITRLHHHAEPERGIRKDHALSERVESIPSRFCSRDAKKAHAQSVYLFEKDCTCAISLMHYIPLARL